MIQTAMTSKTTVTKALDDFTSFIHGNNIPVSSEMTTLHFHDESIERTTAVKFPFPSQEKLAHLYNDCAQPASFGKGSQTVLDPSYRSAKTIIADHFAINLRPDAHLLDHIATLMLNSQQQASNDMIVRAQLYRVNIYGPGDFFKEHKDTPQSQSGHFGSLVFCLPTVFEGGAFGLRNPQGKVMTLDWGATYTAAAHGTPSTGAPGGGTVVSPPIEYVAFASDLDH